MSIKKKIFLVISTVLILSGIVIISIWYRVSSKLTDTYLKSISESTMLDACHAFEYLLKDTSYMAFIISSNNTNIIKPMEDLNNNKIENNGQWNKEYLRSRRIIERFIKELNGYKYYIVGITVVAKKDCIFSTSHLMQDNKKIYEKILELDQDKLKKNMIMMNPIHVEGGKSTYSSDYVVPAIKGITDWNQNLLGYVILYFDYGVIENIFSSNLPEGSKFQVINANKSIIFSNCNGEILNKNNTQKGFVYSEFEVKDIEWKFTLAVPSNYYVKGINKTVLLTMGLMIFILILSGVAEIIIISKMTKRITLLRDRMKQVSKGNLNALYPVKSKDEIGQIGTTFNNMVTRINELMNEVAEEEKQKHKVEMDFLQAQINPHFISNVLNTVIWMAKVQHAGNIVPLITSLNSLLQSAMHRERDMILLKDELAYVDNYLTMIEYSGSYDFLVEKYIKEKDIEGIYVPKFILQPIVENSVYHGIPKDLSRQGVIRIFVEIRNEKLYIAIEDNGSGMSEIQIKELFSKKVRKENTFNGLGVQNVNERLKLFFGKNYELKYESKEDRYTRAVFVLPIIKEEKFYDKS